MAARNNREATYRLALSALLMALMLILGYVESLIPLGTAIPGIKLGLSNGVLIFAVYMLDIPTAYVLMALKVVLSGMMFSGVSAMLYGLAGGLLSLTGMALLSRAKRIPVPAVSVIGGVLHNAGQIGLSLVILHLPVKSMLIYLAVLTVVGAACGLLTGVCAKSVMKHLRGAGLRMLRKETARPRRGVIVLACVAVLAAAFAAWYCLPKLNTSGSTTVWEDDGNALPAGLDTLNLPSPGEK